MIVHAVREPGTGIAAEYYTLSHAEMLAAIRAAVRMNHLLSVWLFVMLFTLITKQ